MEGQTVKCNRISAALCLLAGPWMAHVSGQSWEQDVELGWLSGLEWNVFHSPSSYRDNLGVDIPVDSLILDDRLSIGRMELDWERDDDQGRWKINSDVSFSRYNTLTAANRRSLEGRITREHALNDRIEGAIGIRLRDETRLGINILGNELLTSFSFFQAQLEADLNARVRSDMELELSWELFRKWYDQRATGESLDQTEWSIELGWSWEPERRVKGLRDLDLVGQKRTDPLGELTADFQHRQKNYANWLNLDILDESRDPLLPTPFMPFDSTFAHPLRTWTYTTATVRYALPEWRGWEVRVDFRTQKRSDLSLGDFGYRDAKSAIRIGHEGDELELTSSLSYTWREYTDRLAEQITPTPYPLLKYNYLRLDLKAEYRLRKGLLLLGLIDFTQRSSNTTAVDRRTRRAYQTGSILIGLSAEFNSP